jgi:hypothetical protein
MSCMPTVVGWVLPQKRQLLAAAFIVSAQNRHVFVRQSSVSAPLGATLARLGVAVTVGVGLSGEQSGTVPRFPHALHVNFFPA